MSHFKFKKSYYKGNTPEKMRKLGDSILISGPVLQAAVVNLPLTDNQIIWVNFSITILTLAGKIWTNFYSDEVIEDEDDKPKNNEPKQIN